MGLASSHKMGIKIITILLSIWMVGQAFAEDLNSTWADPAPPCLSADRKSALSNMNQQVYQWLMVDPSGQFHRALITGTITNLYGVQKGQEEHTHFAIDINGDQRGDVEVIYQDDFGALPPLKVGMQITACGDYKTEQMPSSMHGFIHYVHSNDGERDNGTCSHPDGYLMINNTVIGITPMNRRSCR